MSEITILAIWSLAIGLIAGVALHASIPAARRTGVMRWCLAIGAFAFGSVGVVTAMGAGAVTTRTAMGLGFAGIPILVAGVVMLALVRLKQNAPAGNGDTPDA